MPDRCRHWARKNPGTRLHPREDAGQEAFLLRFGPDGDNRRPDQALADRGRLWSVGDGQLFLENGLLDEGGAAAAKFLGPGDACITSFEELALPIA